jgi:hypothetical protein
VTVLFCGLATVSASGLIWSVVNLFAIYIKSAKEEAA